MQALAGADEIVVTDDVLSIDGAAELVADQEIESSNVELKGVAARCGCTGCADELQLGLNTIKSR